MNPSKPFNTIALSLSGGGYRAASFHLGTLTYLSEKKWQQKNLLERVHILSTVSGGTFTGLKYAALIKNGKSIEDCYKELYLFMSDLDMLEKTLDHLTNLVNWNNAKQRTLINSFAQLYEKEFESSQFELFWRDEPAIHLKEIIFNATEFNFAIPFRFQKTEQSENGKGGFDYGYIGNNKIRIPVDVAKEILLADILAASSCFPLGFEPINFPDDFKHDKSKLLKKDDWFPLTAFDGDEIVRPVGLMDGGVDDNQGIESVILAEKRMQRYKNVKKENTNENKIDLFIISDVSSPYMESYVRSTSDKIPYIGNLTFTSFNYLALLFFILAVIAFSSFSFINNRILLLFVAIFGTANLIAAIISLCISRIINFLCKKFELDPFFKEKLTYFNKLPFGIFFNLIVNRIRSAKSLVSDVLMKQVRRFGYYRIYNDATWNNRLIANTVYDLSSQQVNKRNVKYPFLTDHLKTPSKVIMEISEKARNMGTTLWFLPGELAKENMMLNTLIACGQFTICFNLLEYIEKEIKNKDNEVGYNAYTEDLRKEIDELYATLLADWEKFQKDPYWMLTKWNGILK